MRYGLIAGLGLCVGVGAAAACSPGSGGKGPGDGAGGGANGGTDSGTGGCSGICLPEFGGAGPGSGTGGLDTGPIEEPEPDPCSAEGTCQDGFLCTVAQLCGEESGSCSTHTDCQGDTYCCDKDCRLDGVDEGVCIPGNVGPGAECKGEATVGVFGPALQCEWKSSDAFGSNVATTPLVGDLPNDSGESAEIVFVSFSGADSNAASKNAPGSIRIIRGDDCTLLETIDDSKNVVRANTTPALADLNGDGTIEIVAYKKDQGLIAFHWTGSKYETFWETNDAPSLSTKQVWSGLAVHNLDTGTPEVLAGFDNSLNTYDGLTGNKIGATVNLGGGTTFNGFIPVVGDLNGDGTPQLITNTSGQLHVISWQGNGWEAPAYANSITQASVNASHFAYADFGTESGGSFDPTKLDGIAEIVKVEDQVASRVAIYTLNGLEVMNVGTKPDAGAQTALESGGPPVIGDFDNDGFPEVGVAGASRFRVFDLDCEGGGDGCESNFVRWSRSSQDASSRQTGASIFDFDGDGKAEAVYADECFLRVYEGESGKVLFSSYRTSGTWYENPVVADVDKDQNTEIVVNSAYDVRCPSGSTAGTPYVDPLHPGVPCLDDTSCSAGGTCTDGYCRCTGDAQCDLGMTCQPALTGGDNTCRATHPNSTDSAGGVRVLRDRLDRWASSRAIWNQHAYSVTNINEDGTVPDMAAWKPNFKEAELNHFRQNAQGATSVDDIPDVTGKLDATNLCTIYSDKLVLTGRVCNRGNRAVGSALPASFYDEAGNLLCVSYTQTPVQGNNDCRAVSCELNPREVSGMVKMVVNDDGQGGRTTVECREDNNTDIVELRTDGCLVVK